MKYAEKAFRVFAFLCVLDIIMDVDYSAYLEESYLQIPRVKSTCMSEIMNRVPSHLNRSKSLFTVHG